MSPVHTAAATGFTANAATYVTGRPDYPPELDGWLRADLGLGAGRTAVDLGAGTGKFLPRLIGTGAAVIAVEPLAAMREQLASRHPHVDARAGTAEAIPLADASVDAVVCAQAFHWFATEAALREIGRVLKPGGTLGLIWNVRDDSVDWVAELARIVEPFAGDAPRYGTRAWRSVFPAEGFGPLAERQFPHAHTGTPERVIVDRTLSISFIAALPAWAQREIAGRVRALIAATPALARRDEVSFPYRTVAFASRRLG